MMYLRSNGKTTTTTLYSPYSEKWRTQCRPGRQCAGKKPGLQVAEEKHDYYVVELSSFQLDGMTEFKAVSPYCSISPDHLDVNYNFQKLYCFNSVLPKIQTHKGPIYFLEWTSHSEELKRHSVNTIYPFALATRRKTKSFYRKRTIDYQYTNNIFTMPATELSSRNRNTYNSMATGLTASIVNIRKKVSTNR